MKQLEINFQSENWQQILISAPKQMKAEGQCFPWEWSENLYSQCDQPQSISQLI